MTNPPEANSRPDLLKQFENEVLVEAEFRNEVVTLAQQAANLAKFLYPGKGAFPNSLLFFSPMDAQAARITPDAKFRLIRCLQLVDHQTKESNALEFALERVSPITEQRAGVIDSLSTTLGDGLRANLNEKGGPKQIRFRVTYGEEAEISQTFRDGCEGGPINTRARRLWPKIKHSLLGLNRMIQEPWVADAEALQTYDTATKADWQTIHQLLYGLNKAMVAELIKTGKMEEYVVFSTAESQEKLHQSTLEPDQTAEIPDPYSTQDPPEKKQFSINDIIERANAETDPLKKLRILQTAIEDITKATAIIMSEIPLEIQRESTELFSTLQCIYRLFDIKRSSFPGADELGSFYKGKQIHNTTFESGKIEANPQELWGGRKWQSKLKRLAHPDRFSTLDLEPKTASRLEEISKDVGQLLEKEDDQPDVIRLALLLHEIHSITADQQALEAYQAVIPLFATKAEQAVELLKQKVEYFNDLIKEISLLDTGEHPLQKGTKAMREHLLKLINVDALNTKGA